MTWIVRAKGFPFPYYCGLSWSNRLKDAKRYATKLAAEIAITEIATVYAPKPVRLVARRRP